MKAPIPVPRGVVCVPVGTQPRYWEFIVSLLRLTRALPDSDVAIESGPDIAHNLNAGIVRGLERVPDAAWFWFIGDDHVFEPDVVHRLWQHQRPVVAAFCLKRAAPYPPVMYRLAAADGHLEHLTPADHQHGLMRAEIVGGAGMLVRRDVIDQFQRPWFENHGLERQGEDIAWCKKLGRGGIPIYVDLETQIGHLTPMEVWPVYDPLKGWVAVLRNRIRQEVL